MGDISCALFGVQLSEVIYVTGYDRKITTYSKVVEIKMML